MPKQAKVNQNSCIGCGTCAALAAKSFKIGDDGKSVAINPPGDDETAVRSAIDSCPVKAIAWEN
jgi:ferredoxin